MSSGAVRPAPGSSSAACCPSTRPESVPAASTACSTDVPEDAAPVTARIPDPSSAPDVAKREGIERALAYQRAGGAVIEEDVGEQPLRQVRGHDANVWKVLGLTDLKISGLALLDLDRLFPVNDRHLVREATHEVLRTLEHEVPPQVRKTEQC